MWHPELIQMSRKQMNFLLLLVEEERKFSNPWVLREHRIILSGGFFISIVSSWEGWWGRSEQVTLVPSHICERSSPARRTSLRETGGQETSVCPAEVKTVHEGSAASRNLPWWLDGVFMGSFTYAYADPAYKAMNCFSQKKTTSGFLVLLHSHQW